MADWDVALPAVDTGADLLASKGKVSLRVQCKGRYAGQQFDQDVPWEGHPDPEFLYLDNGIDFWLVPLKEFKKATGRARRYSCGGGKFWWHFVARQKLVEETLGKYAGQKGVLLLDKPLTVAELR
jgi:hypothetical protein